MGKLRYVVALLPLLLASGASAQVASGWVTTNNPNYTNNTPNPLSLDGKGNLRTSTSLVPGTGSGGTLTFDAGVTNAVAQVKASQGQLYGYHLFDSGAGNCYLQMFNAIPANVTLGTTPPFKVLGIPAGGGAARSFSVPASFGTAISIAATTTRTGSTACGAVMDVDIDYD